MTHSTADIPAIRDPDEWAADDEVQSEQSLELSGWVQRRILELGYGGTRQRDAVTIQTTRVVTGSKHPWHHG